MSLLRRIAGHRDTATLGAPVGFDAVARDAHTIELEWDALIGSLAYAVYRDGVALPRTTAPSYIDTGLTAETSYSYSVRAVNGAGEGTATAAVARVTLENVAPVWTLTSIEALNGQAYSLLLTTVCTSPVGLPLVFTEVTALLDDFGTAIVGQSITGTVSGGAASYSVTLRASDGVNQTDVTVTATVSAAAGPSQPTLNWLGSSQTAITFTWTAPASAIALRDYTVQRSTTSGGALTDIATGLTSLEYTDASLSAGTTRYYKLVAYDVNGNASTASAEVTAITQAAAATAFTFTDVASAVAGSQNISNLITVAGLSQPAVLDAGGSEYSKNGGAYVTAKGFVVNTDTARVRQNASGTAGATVSVTLSYGDRSDSYDVTTAGVLNDNDYGPRLGQYNQGGIVAPLPQAQIVARAMHRYIVVTDVGNGTDAHKAMIDAIHVVNPNTEIFPYVNFNEHPSDRNRTAGVNLTLWDAINRGATGGPGAGQGNAGNLWARDPYPGGASPIIFAAGSTVNFPLSRATSLLPGGLRYPEYQASLYLDSPLNMTSRVRGLFGDNCSAAGYSGYDYNEDGTTEGKRNIPLIQSRLAGFRVMRDYLHARNMLFFANGSFQWYDDHVRGNVNYLSDLIGIFDGAVLELPTGIWNSKGGYFYYNANAQVGSVDYAAPGSFTVVAYPPGGSGSPPPNGTLCKNVFGSDWLPANQTGNALVLAEKPIIDWFMANAIILDRRRVFAQIIGPDPKYAKAPYSYPQVMRYWRWNLMKYQVYTDFSTGFGDMYARTAVDSVNSRSHSIVLDEYKTGHGAWGQPLTPSGYVAGKYNGGAHGELYVRQWGTSAGVVTHVGVVNMSSNGTKTITLPNIPGRVYRRVNAASWGNQDPTTNDGQLLGGLQLTIQDRDGALFEVEPA